MSPPLDVDQRPLEPPGAALRRVRARAPLVQNITNFVAMNPAANILLAVGASPAMVHAREEAGEFARIADALTINIGTLSPVWLDGMLVAAAAAADAGKPWVLDPVAVGATALRRDAARRLLELSPSLVRGNASEIIALAPATRVGTGADTSGGKGVDATDPVAAAELAAVTLAERQGCVVAVTGEIDFVTDGRRAAHIANGHVMMPQVTALGCALTGVCGAFLGAGGDPFECTVAALAYYGLAGEHAARGADGPGSFALCFIDALSGLSADALDKDARIAPIAVPSPHDAGRQW
ncbi:MAG: hydroxyethylthiazole kinase [Thiohalocapsa sp.]|jgi:hydroxyethylthiazole kinase|uniref:hydroxyethylthiazole kinase n=1 Tax=Thiohalocapsa sp. TaxID=2497641 RepID=UPI0025CD4B96|nr:hydroxyethylthiazole kinase [Thiohalocapsa sp.]MCG6942726.1 hydroxyethylthiazole kinase [Thiohalocapsa sp.]